MAKKKQSDAPEAPPGTVTDMPPPEHPPQPATTSRGELPPGDGNGSAEGPPATSGKRKPDQTYKVYSDKTTLLEVAIWENEVRYDDKVSVQHSITLSRSFRNSEGKWVQSTTYRTHDLPHVRVLLDLAHAWCVGRRTEDGSCPF